MIRARFPCSAGTARSSSRRTPLRPGLTVLRVSGVYGVIIAVWCFNTVVDRGPRSPPPAAPGTGYLIYSAVLSAVCAGPAVRAQASARSAPAHVS